MYPILFELGPLKLYAYGLLIGLGIVMSISYLTKAGANDINLKPDLINQLLIYLIIAAVVGGKFLLIFENPTEHLQNLSGLISGSGFVFYGSLLFCFGVLFWFIKKHKLPALPFLDLIAIVICILHACGRLGCFMAGCCYGKATDSWLGVVYTHPKSSAPINCSLHPVQLYESLLIGCLLLVLYLIKRKRAFNGQIFALYLILYPSIRMFTETFRGDEERGLLFNETLSHSQLISIILILAGIILYRKWQGQANAIKKL